MIALLILFGVLGALLIAVGSRLGRSAFLIGAVAPAATVAWVVLRLGAVLDGRTPSQHFEAAEGDQTAVWALREALPGL